MLTPAEELGLSGLGLATQVRQALAKLPEGHLATLIQCIETEAAKRHLIYLRDGKQETIRLLHCPVAALPDQRSYIHYVSLTNLNALKRLPELYLQDFAVREVLRLLALGHTNQEIAHQLYISVRTAETHRAHIMQKLRLQSRAELVRYALDHGLLEE